MPYWKLVESTCCLHTNQKEGEKEISSINTSVSLKRGVVGVWMQDKLANAFLSVRVGYQQRTRLRERGEISSGKSISCRIDDKKARM